MKIVLVVLAAMVFMASSICVAENIALKANWTPNADTVTTGYKLYRTDGSRVLVGTIPGKTTSQYLLQLQYQMEHREVYPL